MSPAASGAAVSKATRFPLADSPPGRSDDEFAACPPVAETLARTVEPVWRSCTNTSAARLVSPSTRFGAVLANATKRPSAEIAEASLAPAAAWLPSPATLTRSMAPVARTAANTSRMRLVSPATRFDAADEKLTTPPSALMSDGASPLGPLPCSPEAETLTRTVWPAARSRTNTSAAPLVSPATRFVAWDVKTTYCPSALMRAFEDGPLACPPAPTETRVVWPVAVSRTNTSRALLVSSGTSAGDDETNATSRPSAESEIESCAELSFAATPLPVTVTNWCWTAAARALPAVIAITATAKQPTASRLDELRTDNLLRANVGMAGGDPIRAGATRKPSAHAHRMKADAGFGNSPAGGTAITLPEAAVSAAGGRRPPAPARAQAAGVPRPPAVLPRIPPRPGR